MITNKQNEMAIDKNLNPVTDADYSALATDYLTYSGANLSQLNAKRFIVKCVLNKLNPYTGDVYAYQSGNNLVCITSYQKYLQTASTCPGRCGEKFTEHYDKEGRLIAITCTVAKYVDVAKVIVPDFVSFTARINEYSTGKNLWATKPSVMLRKCAHVNALRQAYPNEFKDMPYTSEEIDEKLIQLAQTLEQKSPEIEHKLTKKSKPKKGDERLTELVDENNQAEVVMVEQMPPHTMPNTNDVSEKIELKFNGNEVEERVMHQQEVQHLNEQQQVQVNPLDNLSPAVRKTAEKYANDPLTIEYLTLLFPFTKQGTTFPPALSAFFAQNFDTQCLKVSQFSQFQENDKQQILVMLKEIIANI